MSELIARCDVCGVTQPLISVKPKQIKLGENMVEVTVVCRECFDGYALLHPNEKLIQNK